MSLFNELKARKAKDSKYDFSGKLIRNTIVTKLGWIYLDKDMKSIFS